MILTGKAKTEFLKWYGTSSEYFTITLKDIEQHANIVEWFDSVGIIIIINNVLDDWWYRVKSKPKILNSERYNDLKSRQEATEKAIKEANGIYNKTFK